MEGVGPGGFRAEKLAELDRAITEAINGGRLPGGVLWIERGADRYVRAYGSRSKEPQLERMDVGTVFDAASLTKVMATTPAIMLLQERGRVDVDAAVYKYLPEFKGGGRESITLRHLLTHTSGLAPGISLGSAWQGYEAGIRLALGEKPSTTPGTAFRYSDVNFLLLGEVVQRVSGEGLDRFVDLNLWKPLGMKDTGFRPPAGIRGRIAPTTREKDGTVIRGEVHDPTSRRMGGVTGHAGVFTTAADVARYGRMLLGGGTLGGVRVFKPETIQLMTHVATPVGVESRRGLGWDIDSPYAGPRGRVLPRGSYGHTGWTGTSMWIDPFSGLQVVFMSNRNHPTEDGNILALRREIGTLAAEAVVGFNFSYVPGALGETAKPDSATTLSTQAVAPTNIVLGVEALARSRFAGLRGKRVGLVTNHTGQDGTRASTIDRLFKAEGVRLEALFSPEHGIRGEEDDRVTDTKDGATGLPVYSLYGATRKPLPEQLRGLDVLVYDIQDIGCRFYTYIATMGLAMEAAQEAKVAFMVLDRPNPITGLGVEGPVYGGASQFIAFHSIPLRHGMTVGELARMFQAERFQSVDLTVMPMEGWRRGHWYDEVGLPWSNPSPNMRSMNAAVLYPGVGLLETAMSVGRGTDTPFEVVGAPFVDDVALAKEMNRIGLEGIRFLPVRFTPKASVFKDRPCRGVGMVITDRNRLKPVEVGIALTITLQRLYAGVFELEKVKTLLREDRTLEMIRTGATLRQVVAAWEGDLVKFRERRAKYLMYR